MFGFFAFAESPFADHIGGIVQAGVAEMSGTSSKTSVGVGILVGESSISSAFTQTAATNIEASGNIDLSSIFTITTENIKLVNLGSLSFDSNFTKSATASITASGVSAQSLNFTKTTSGDILYTPVVTNAITEAYTEITPSGAETWTEITPSGAETWTEIDA